MRPGSASHSRLQVDARAWREAPTIATTSTLRSCTAFFHTLGGLILLIGSPFLRGDGVDHYRLLVLGAIGIVSGAIVWRTGSSYPRIAFQLLTLVGTTAIAVGVFFGGTGSAMVSLTAPFMLPVVAAALLFSLREALPMILVTEAIAAIAMLHGGSSAGDVIVVEGCTLAMAGMVAWLARLANAVDEDPLTLLLNRRGFDRRLDEALRHAGRGGTQLSLAVLDLDYFKQVNDSQGHESGDRLLVACAHAWRDRLPEGAALSRYGGDEFLLLLPDTPLGRAADLADSLRSLTPVTVSAGVAGWHPGDSGSTLLNRADVALYEAKTNGRDRTVVYGDPGREASELESAISAGQMRVHLQPVINLADDTVRGFEALVRWQHPTKGLVPPMEFVPQAERTGAIHSLGAWVMAEACRLAAEMPGPPRCISVNASVHELRGHDYPQKVRALLERTHLPGTRLIVEVTEGAFEDDDDQVERNLKELRRLGILVAIDDFGSGYSSLRRIEHLPIDIIKIDGALTESIREDSHEAPILAAIATMGRSLGVRLVAERVETEHQAETLRRLGYDLAQGYLFGRPAPAEALRTAEMAAALAPATSVRR